MTIFITPSTDTSIRFGTTPSAGTSTALGTGADTGPTPTVLPSLRAVRAATDTLMRLLATTDLADPRRESAGPLVSAAAESLRQALGSPSQVTSVSAPAVVREADLATAARRLLADDAELVDPAAGRDYVLLAVDASLALA